ncbi:MAG: hypothetical protein K5679_11750 [Lachnospiraceae bacterium]|nr:hypothetical protein [Lachnospiraceae bacterium]
MKKNIKLAAVVLASMLVLAACGKTESVEASVSETSAEASVETSVEASVEEVVEEVVEKEEEEVASVEEEVKEATASTLEEYFANNDAEYQAMKAQEASVEGLTISVEGNVVLYTYALPIEVDETTAPTYAAAFEEQMAADSASVKQLVDAVKLVEQGSGIEGIVFSLSYVDANGVEVYACKVDANGVVEE